MYSKFELFNCCFLVITLMADASENPPVFVSTHPFHLDRNGILPTSLRLQHHFFLTRFKIVVREVAPLDKTDALAEGIFNEMV
jgi:hypothetical protein